MTTLRCDKCGDSLAMCSQRKDRKVLDAINLKRAGKPVPPDYMDCARWR